MFTKRAKPDSYEASHAKRLRNNLGNLYLNNDVSAQRAHTLFDDAQNMRRPEQFGRLASSQVEGNMVMDLGRRMLKGSKRPSVYYAKIRTWSPNENKMVRTWMPSLLPCEPFMSLLLVSTKENMLKSDSMSQATKDQLPWRCQFAVARLVHQQTILGQAI